MGPTVSTAGDRVPVQRAGHAGAQLAFLGSPHGCLPWEGIGDGAWCWLARLRAMFAWLRPLHSDLCHLQAERESCQAEKGDPAGGLAQARVVAEPREALGGCVGRSQSGQQNERGLWATVEKGAT